MRPSEDSRLALVISTLHGETSLENEHLKEVRWRIQV